MNFSYPSAPLVSPLTVAFSEENPFIIKLRTFYRVLSDFFQWLQTILLCTPVVPPPQRLE